MPQTIHTPPPDTGPEGDFERVLVEMQTPKDQRPTAALEQAVAWGLTGTFIADLNYAPVPVTGERGSTVIIRGALRKGSRDVLMQRAGVIAVWSDPPIAPCVVDVRPGRVPCPYGDCDCTPGLPKGTLAQVAADLDAPRLWARSIRGTGIVVAVADGGITALGRPVQSGETPRIPRVIGGFPVADWGTTARQWNEHGNMCATDVLGLAPDAYLYDLRLSDPQSGGAVSAALAAFQWSIEQHRATGAPHVLTNSWAVYQGSQAPDYSTNPNHPFTRKVVEAIDEGILVLFAAGNCGATCPASGCGGDTGPGRSIWGANGHPRVMTVGAVNRLRQLAGYSSQGPAALDPRKPDFCAYTHFTGYFTSDNGTSAATPVAAGVVALLAQAKPGLTQAAARQVLMETAQDLGPGGWDNHCGAGLINAGAACDRLVGAVPPVPAVERLRLDTHWPHRVYVSQSIPAGREIIVNIRGECGVWAGWRHGLDAAYCYDAPPGAAYYPLPKPARKMHINTPYGPVNPQPEAYHPDHAYEWRLVSQGLPLFGSERECERVS